MLNDIDILAGIKPVNYNIQTKNGIKDPANFFGLVIIKTPKTKIIISPWSSYYMLKNTISQTALKNYIQFMGVKTKALQWLQLIIDTGNKIKVETQSKERDQKILYLITIEIINVERQKSPVNYIITLTMYPILNISFNKHPISWELIHHSLLHTY